MTLVNVQAEGASNLPPQLLALDQRDFIVASLGMFVELGELVNEAQWKPWRHYEAPTAADRQKLLKELGDVLHFLPWMIRNLQARFGITVVDVADAFLAAHEENVRRFTGQVAGREPPPAAPIEGIAEVMLLEYCPKCGGSWSCTPGSCTLDTFGRLPRS